MHSKKKLSDVTEEEPDKIWLMTIIISSEVKIDSYGFDKDEQFSLRTWSGSLWNCTPGWHSEVLSINIADYRMTLHIETD